MNDPELVFLDEPTTGLDPAARRALWTLIEELKAAGTSVLLTTHYMEEAEILCDRLAIMDHGKVLELGTVEELVSKHFKDRAVRFDPVEALDTALLESLRRSARSTSTTPTRWSSRATSARRSARSSPPPRTRGRAAEPVDPASVARGRVPQPDRSGAAGLTAAMTALWTLTVANIRSFTATARRCSGRWPSRSFSS